MTRVVLAAKRAFLSVTDDVHGEVLAVNPAVPIHILT